MRKSPLNSQLVLKFESMKLSTLSMVPEPRATDHTITEAMMNTSHSDRKNTNASFITDQGSTWRMRRRTFLASNC
jgi:hypothetical protein